MNLDEIKNIIDHLKKTSKCPECKAKYKMENINIIATTNAEALFELICEKCENKSIANVVFSETNPLYDAAGRKHRKISQDDILDVKNFLNNFDGNFKKIFSKKK